MTCRLLPIRTPALGTAVFLSLALAFLMMPVDGARAQSLQVDISKHDVSITTSFIGSNLLLFGTTGGTGDVIVVVRGPRETQVVRRKERVAGIWVNKDNVTFRNIPSFYEIISNKKIDDILPAEVLAKLRIGINHIELETEKSAYSAETLREFRAALIRRKAAQGLYSNRETGVFFSKPTLFRAEVRFPVSIQVGTYEVDSYLVRDGRVISLETTKIPVKKAGFEAEVYNFAHRQSFAYGVLAVVVAVMAGWLASAIFRKA